MYMHICFILHLTLFVHVCNVVGALQEEFADSLGMNPKSKFVELMFNVADKQKRGFLRYREILELVIIMSQGL